MGHYRLVTSKVWSSLLLSLFLVGCRHQNLIVENEWVSVRSLASYWVRTPDPLRYCPPTGQKLILSWSLPEAYFEQPDLHLELTVRFSDNEEDFISIPITCGSGRYVYSLLNDAYWDHGGIRTYLAQIVGDGCVLEEWRHALWAELILFDSCDEEDNDHPR